MKYYTVAIVLVLAATAQCGFFGFLLRGAARLNPVLNVVSTAIDVVDALKSNGQLEKILAATNSTATTPAPQGGDCLANHPKDESLCQGHGYDQDYCLKLSHPGGPSICHWEPAMTPAAPAPQGGDCWANHPKDESLCQGHGYDQDYCLKLSHPGGPSICHWG